MLQDGQDIPTVAEAEAPLLMECYLPYEPFPGAPSPEELLDSSLQVTHVSA